MTNIEIRNEFEHLSSISWSDYCELCAREHEAAVAAEVKGSDADLGVWLETYDTARAAQELEDAADSVSDWMERFWEARAVH